MTVPSLFGDSDSHEGAAAIPERSIEPASSGAGSASTSSLYRKYRPQSFDSDELVGQEHIVRTLQNAVRLDRVAHAYLFSGPRGTGKTTTARVLAKAINCLARRSGLTPLQCLPELPGDQRRCVARHHRDRRGEQPRHRRHPGSTRARPVRARSAALEGLHHRRVAPDHRSSRKRLPQDAGRAAGAYSFHPRHHRSRRAPARRSSPAASGSTFAASAPTTWFAGCKPSPRSRAFQSTPTRCG